jgi:peptide/bleomycin uptake transporter
MLFAKALAESTRLPKETIPMFKSFFPSPKLFFTSGAVWSLFCVLLWYFSAKNWGGYIGLPNPASDAAPVLGVGLFWTNPFLWFYIYYAAITFLFAAAWSRLSPHPWFLWSVLGTSLVIFIVYFQVQVSVAINEWYGPFGDLLQKALSTPKAVKAEEFYTKLLDISSILLFAACIFALARYFIVHYIFRWRTAMNEFYTSQWQKLRHVEGASQRVQEDSMRLAQGMEGLGVGVVDSVMTLLAFLPVLAKLSEKITELPLVGAVPYSLVIVSIIWSVFGTAFLALIGIKLPGLEFKNQRVEAAFRKELVFGEESADRADKGTLDGLFEAVRKNYFVLYFNQLYFNFGRRMYSLADNIFSIVVLIPTVVSGTITLGDYSRINNSFDQVRSSFQFLVSSWDEIVRMISIYKRLRIFEAAIEGNADIAADEAYGASVKV